MFYTLSANSIMSKLDPLREISKGKHFSYRVFLSVKIPGKCNTPHN